MGFIEDVQKTTLCGDGGIRPLLAERGIEFPLGVEELCIREPDRIIDIHREYIAAGARVIRTNSLQANLHYLSHHQLAGHVNEINWQAAQLAKMAAKETGAYVAGSVGPLGITEEEAKREGWDRRAVFQEQIGALLDGGVNLVLFEDFTDVEELLLALYVKQSLHHCPAIGGLSMNAPIPLADAFLKLHHADAEVLGMGGVLETESLRQLISQVSQDATWAVYLAKNAMISSSHIDEFAKSGIGLIGGDRDADPEDIRKIAAVLGKGESS